MTLLNHPSFAEFGFYDYQRRWLNDASRFKIGLWSRQTGKDFCAAAEAVFDCHLNPGTTWVVLAAGERQALESIAKAKDWARALDLIVADYTENFDAGNTLPKVVAPSRRGKKNMGGRTPTTMLNSAEIKFANNSRFIALPAKPETVRGYSANLILTEFAFHDDPDAIWRAIYPSISNPLRGGEKKLRIISTPNGLTNKFADLWHNAADYTKHRTDIYEAVRDGLKLDIAKLKAGLNDPDAWTQEYECQFIDTTSILLPYDLIQSCESTDATETSLFAGSSPLPGGEGQGEGGLLVPTHSPRYFLGIDFARKNHLTVAWLLEKLPANSQSATYVTRHVLTLRNMSTPEQVEQLRPLLKLAGRASIDYTGGGIGLGDYLVQEFGEWNPGNHRTGKIELCQFTPALKGELFPRLRTAFEKQEVLIPSSREIREDLHSIHRVVSTTGQITYRSSQSGDGHSDRCTALALALRAAVNGPVSPKPISIYVPERSPRLNWARRLILHR